MEAKKIIVPTAILTVIVLVVTSLLVLTNNATKDKIAELKAANDEAAKKEVLAEADSFIEREVVMDENTSFRFFEAENGAGYVFTTSYKGYGGPVECMTGISADGEITGVKLTSQNETPGLGAKAAGTDDFGNSWRGQFVGRTADGPAQVTKDGGDIDAIAGATITSRAVSNAVSEAIEQYQTVTGGVK